MNLSSEFYQLRFGNLYTTRAVADSETELRHPRERCNEERGFICAGQGSQEIER